MAPPNIRYITMNSNPNLAEKRSFLVLSLRKALITKSLRGPVCEIWQKSKIFFLIKVYGVLYRELKLVHPAITSTPPK